MDQQTHRLLLELRDALREDERDEQLYTTVMQAARELQARRRRRPERARLLREIRELTESEDLDRTPIEPVRLRQMTPVPGLVPAHDTDPDMPAIEINDE